jgi:hypothetical protein
VLNRFKQPNQCLRLNSSQNQATRHTGKCTQSNFHYVTSLNFKHYHYSNLHIGPLGLLHAIRARYWLISGRSIAKKTCRNCVSCCRASPVAVLPQMGHLPDFRVTLHPLFIIAALIMRAHLQKPTRSGQWWLYVGAPRSAI